MSESTVDGKTVGATSGPPVLDFSSPLLNSGLGYYRYYITRNDKIWGRLNESEKAFVKAHNKYWNNNNPGYKDPDHYQGQGGRSFKSNADRLATWEGRQIRDFLTRHAPESLLEVGPGSGFYTRQIIECPTTRRYVATDINAGFLDYIKGAVGAHPRSAGIRTDFVEIEALDRLAESFDSIILLSALHHVPDRIDFVRALATKLRPGGRIFFFEPTHSLLRVTRLTWSFLRHGWFLTKAVRRRNNFMTHHFCSSEETRDIARAADLELEYWHVNGLLPSSLGALAEAASREMIAVLRRSA